MNIAQVITRLLQLIPVIIGVTFIVFSLMYLTPGDPVEVMFGGEGAVSEEDLARIRRELGLDRPFFEQYLRFLGGLLRGDLGMSLVQRQPVARLIAGRLPATIELTAAAILVSLVIAIPAGVISAVRRYSTIDKLGTLGTLLGVSMPDFWLGLVFILLFGITWKVLPISGRMPFGMEPEHVTGLFVVDAVLTRDWVALKTALRHLALPAITLGTSMAALTMRVTRSSMLEVVQQDYITFARAKGLSGTQVVLGHALKNALIPTVTVVTLNIGILLGGNMIVESVFAWPGLGRLVVDSIYNRDYTVVQAAVLIYAITYVTMNFLADVLYTVLNPRVRF
ncbi:MAG: ABC transporter permease [Limnochordales bacterium]|nr:MAG: peptide ABC transporter permease [Bacillota bacterium]